MEVNDDYWVSTFHYATPSTQYLNLLEKVLSSDVNTAATPWTAGDGATGWVPMRRKTRGPEAFLWHSAGL